MAGHQVVVLPLRGTLRVFSESLEAGLTQQAVAPCSFGVMGILPLCLDKERVKYIPPYSTKVIKAKRAVQAIHGSASFAFLFPHQAIQMSHVATSLVVF